MIYFKSKYDNKILKSTFYYLIIKKNKMVCFTSKNINSGMLIIYNRNLIELKGENYSYARLLELISQRTLKKSSVLSVSHAGNVFRVKNDRDLSSLKISKGSDEEYY